MKTAAAILCVLVLSGASASRVRRDARASVDHHASVNDVETTQWRQSSEPSPFAGLTRMLPMLRGLWSVGAQLISSLGMDGVGQDVARALQESDPVELALNTIQLDTAPCRQRLACEIRSPFSPLAFEVVASQVPSLKKYSRLSLRQLGFDTCSEAFACRYADSPLMDTARQMRSMAGDYCSTDSETLTGQICLAFSYVMDTLESL